MDIKPDPKLWATVTIVVAIIGCIGLLGSALINALPDLLRPTPTPRVENVESTNPPQPTLAIIVATDTEFIGTVPTQAPTLVPTQTQCDWLQNNLPQSGDQVIAKFGFPSGTTIQFIYEICPYAANGFAFKTNPNVVIELQVPDGGCIDSWSGFTQYVGDVGTPVPDGHGGWRVYRGGVRAPEMTYRVAGCN